MYDKVEDYERYKIFANRHDPGIKWQLDLRPVLESVTFDVVDHGIEKLMKGDKLKKFYKHKGDDSIRDEIRFMSDYIAWRDVPHFPRAFWDAKTQVRRTCNFTIEQVPFDYKMSKGEKVVFAFRDYDEVNMYAAWIWDLDKIKIPHQGGKGGSGEPFYLIPIRTLTPLYEFVEKKF